MGIGPGYKHRNTEPMYRDTSYTTVPRTSNPDPKKFKYLSLAQVKDNVVAKVQYEGCTNYEGIKIILYRNTKVVDLANAKVLDPHFTKTGLLRPFARFEPTPEGMQAAHALAESLR